MENRTNYNNEADNGSNEDVVAQGSAINLQGYEIEEVSR